MRVAAFTTFGQRWSGADCRMLIAPSSTKSILNASILNGALELLPQSRDNSGDHSTADAHGLSHRQGLWLRARQRTHQRNFSPPSVSGTASLFLERADRRLIGGLFTKLVREDWSADAGGATGMAPRSATTYAARLQPAVTLPVAVARARTC